MNFSMGADSQTTKEGSDPCGYSKLSAGSLSPAKIEKRNHLYSSPCPQAIKYVKSREKKYQALQCETLREPGEEAELCSKVA